MTSEETARLTEGLRSAGWTEARAADFADYVENGPDRQITRKAMAYDLQKAIDAVPYATLTKEEIKQLIADYVRTAD